MAKSSAAISLHGAPSLVFAASGSAPSGPATPIWFVDTQSALDAIDTISARQRTWLAAQGFKPSQRQMRLLPADDGSIVGVVMGAGSPSTAEGRLADPLLRVELLAGSLAQQLPPGRYTIASPLADAELAAVAWGLGSYKFRKYKTGSSDLDATPQLVLPDSIDGHRVRAIVEACAFGRDLINTPASDMGPAEIEDAVRLLAKVHGAKVSSVIGEDLLVENFPLIHAVGRASPRAPRLIDLTWQPSGHKGPLPRVTLVGKGIAFDTGGLDIKPPASMLMMKKDMAGSATAIAIAHMIMATRLPVRLRLLVAAAENSVAGNAFRPQDVIKSRAGATVEIGNTDAEGRLVLADALALADTESPDLMMTFATLTGAARVALGADLPPLFTDDEALATSLYETGLAVADPVWRLPFWPGYEALLESPVADLNNVSDGPFAGAITAALFLRRFVKKTRSFAHFDIYAWRQQQKPLGPKGAEVTAARAVFAQLDQMFRQA